MLLKVDRTSLVFQVPRQPNTFDCGVCVLAFAKWVLQVSVLVDGTDYGLCQGLSTLANSRAYWGRIRRGIKRHRFTLIRNSLYFCADFLTLAADWLLF